MIVNNRIDSVPDYTRRKMECAMYNLKIKKSLFAAFHFMKRENLQGEV